MQSSYRRNDYMGFHMYKFLKPKVLIIRDKWWICFCGMLDRCVFYITCSFEAKVCIIAKSGTNKHNVWNPIYYSCNDFFLKTSSTEIMELTELYKFKLQITKFIEKFKSNLSSILCYVQYYSCCASTYYLISYHLLTAWGSETLSDPRDFIFLIFEAMAENLSATASILNLKIM